MPLATSRSYLKTNGRLFPAAHTDMVIWVLSAAGMFYMKAWQNVFRRRKICLCFFLISYAAANVAVSALNPQIMNSNV